MLITTIFFATIKVPYIVKGSIAIRSETSSVSAPTLELTDDSLATYSGIEMAIAPYGRDDIFFQTTSTEKDHSYKFEGDDLPEGVTILDTFCIDKNFRGDKKEVKLAIGPARAQGDAGEMKLDRLPGAAKWDSETTKRVLINSVQTVIFLNANGRLSVKDAQDLYEMNASLAYVKGGMPKEFSTWARQANANAIQRANLPEAKRSELRRAFERTSDESAIKDLAIKNDIYIEKMKKGGLADILTRTPTDEDIRLFVAVKPEELYQFRGLPKNFEVLRTKLTKGFTKPEDSVLAIKPESRNREPWKLTLDDFLTPKYAKLKIDQSANLRAYFLAESLLSKITNPELKILLQGYIDKLKVEPGGIP